MSRDTLGWGLVTGVVSAATAWLGDFLSSGGPISLFPDLLSLITLVIVATIALRRLSDSTASGAEANRRVRMFGATAGVVIALATLLRGLMRWSSPSVGLGAVTLIGSFLVVIVIISILARLTLPRGRPAA